MKLIILIPCYNEAQTLPLTIRDLPRRIDGVEVVEYLVVDDGSTDGTAEVANAAGVHHVLRLKKHQGLAAAFAAGLQEALRLGGDVIVNTDADNQYYGADIEKLVRPVLQGKADLVIGDRQVEGIPHFSFIKKTLQKLGSRVVRYVSGTDVPDAASGFRAISRDMALRLNVFSSYTPVLETIIQAGRSGMTVLSVPIRTNPPARASRLIQRTSSYLLRQGITILRIFIVYMPLRFFGCLGVGAFGLGVLIGLRFLYYYLAGAGQGHVQSLILSSILMTIGFQLGALGLLADLISVNRRVLEEVQYRLRRSEQGDQEKTR